MRAQIVVIPLKQSYARQVCCYKIEEKLKVEVEVRK